MNGTFVTHPCYPYVLGSIHVTISQALSVRNLSSGKIYRPIHSLEPRYSYTGFLFHTGTRRSYQENILSLRLVLKQ